MITQKAWNALPKKRAVDGVSIYCNFCREPFTDTVVNVPTPGGFQLAICASCSKANFDHLPEN